MGGGGGEAGMGGGPPVPPTAEVNCDELPEAGTYVLTGYPDTSSDDCTQTLSATGVNDQEEILTAIVFASPGDTICLNEGEYDMAGTVDITDKPGLTLKGIGDTPNDVVLNYADEEGTCRGGKGINVTVDNVTIENLTVKNTCENAVEQRDVDGSPFRQAQRVVGRRAHTRQMALTGFIRLTAKTPRSSGTRCRAPPTLGFTSASATAASWENNLTHQNVAGLEVENCLDVTVSNNLMIDNTGGLFALQQDIDPGGMQTNSGIEMFDNQVYCNNRSNFAKEGAVVSAIPAGSGFISLSGNGIEIYNNDIQQNGTTSVSRGQQCARVSGDGARLRRGERERYSGLQRGVRTVRSEDLHSRQHLPQQRRQSRPR